MKTYNLPIDNSICAVNVIHGCIVYVLFCLHQFFCISMHLSYICLQELGMNASLPTESEPQELSSFVETVSFKIVVAVCAVLLFIIFAIGITICVCK